MSDSLSPTSNKRELVEGDNQKLATEFELGTAVSSDGTQIATYRLVNPGKPWLIMVHGYPDDHSVWLPLVAQLKEHYSIGLYDTRRAGASGKPAAISSYQLGQLANDLWAASEVICPSESFYLIGHDWGSIQAWEPVCEARFSQKLLGFTSISGPCLDHVGRLGRDSNTPPKQTITQLLSSWYIAFFHLPVLPELLIQRIESYFPKISKKPNQASFLSDAQHGIKLYRANMIQRLALPRKLKAVCPVHVILMTRDAYVKPYTYRDLDKLASNNRVSEFDAEHWGIYTHPVPLAPIVRQGFAEMSR